MMTKYHTSDFGHGFERVPAHCISLQTSCTQLTELGKCSSSLSYDL